MSSSRSPHKSKSLKSRSSTRTFKSSLETQESSEPPMPTLNRSKSSFSMQEQPQPSEPRQESPMPMMEPRAFTEDAPKTAPTPDLWMHKPKPVIHQANLSNHSSKRSTLMSGLILNPPTPDIQPSDQRPFFARHKSTPSKGHCIDCGVEVH
jgi:hypothetical protein